MRSWRAGSGRTPGRWGWTHRYGVHLLLASVVAVVLAGGGLAAVLALDLDGGEPTDCVVGRWLVVEQEQDVPLGVLRLVGEGPVVEYRADGTGYTDYGERADYSFADTALFGLGDTEVVISGVVYHDYVPVAEGRMRYVDLRSEATIVVPGALDVTLELSDEPFTYTCDRDVLTQSIEDRYSARLERLD